MKRKAFVAIIIISLLLSVMLTAIGGDGRLFVIEKDEGMKITQEAPIEIHDWYDLNDTRDNLNGDYILMNDLDKNTAGYEELVNNTKGWDPIGDYKFEFNGSFNGNGHKIRDLYIDRGTGYVGLFEVLGPGAEVTDVELVDVDLSGNWGVGGLAGWNEGIVINSSAAGDVNGHDYVGGLLGITLNGTVKNSHSTCEVSGNNRVGGLIGGFYSGSEVINSYADGDVVGERYTEEGCVGGLIGANRGSTVEKSYASGDVNGYENVGGLIGENDHLVNDSYATGEVNGRYKVAGLIGINKGQISNSYATGNVSGYKKIGGLVGSLSGKVNNSHYNIDEVLINGGNHITIGGLFDEQYKDWIKDKRLDIEDYSDTLVPDGRYYEISDVKGIRYLLGFAGDGGKKFRLSDDIYLSDEPELHIPHFSGEFDGNNHTVYGLNLNKSFVAQLGLFSYNDGGKIENIDLVDAEIVGDINVGALVGINNNGKIANATVDGYLRAGQSAGLLCGVNKGTVKRSFVKGTVHTQDDYHNIGGAVGINEGDIEDCGVSVEVAGNISDLGLRQNLGGLTGKNAGMIRGSDAGGLVAGSVLVGGLVGRNDEGEIVNSSSTANVTGQEGVGGLVGNNQGGLIFQSCSKGEVTGYGNNIGGLVGSNSPSGEGSGIIERSFASSKVNGSGALNVGGLVGYNSWHVYTYVNDSYASGDVKGKHSVGGLIGYQGGYVTNTYSLGEVTGNKDVAGLMGTNTGYVTDSFSLDGPDIGNRQGHEYGRVTVADGSDLKNSSFYTQISYSSYYDLEKPWDFVGNPNDDEGDEDIWEMDEEGLINDGYPFLTWEKREEKVTKPSAPENLQASAGDKEVELDWKPPSDDGGGNIIEYRIYRGTNSEDLSKYESVDGNTTSYTDTGLKNGVTYYYQVSAINDAGEGNRSTEVSATPFSAVTPPSKPEDLQASAGDKQVELTWSAPSDDGGSNVTEYRIYRGTNGENLGQYDIVDGNTTSYLDTDVKNEETYYYSVSAVNSAGEGKVSVEVSATPTPEEDTTPPTADAGSDKKVEVGESFTLDGSGSSDNVGIDTYHWDLDNGDTRTGEQIAYTYDEPGTYTVELTVTDEAGNTDTDTTTITVEELDGGDTPEDDTPGFATMLLILGAVIALVIFHNRKR